MANRFSIDPVCGMKVAEPAKISCAYKGEHYAFCCPRCREKFLSAPETYLKPAKPAKPAAYPPGTRFICPMDPEVRADRPGPCPVCGMALEPETPVAGDDGEYRAMRRKCIVAAALTALVIAMGMAPVSAPAAGVLQGIAATVLLAFPARFLLTRGFASLRTLHFNMFTLILLGIGTAWGVSVAALVWPGWVLEGLRAEGFPRLFFEPAAMIATLIILGQMLEARARFVTGGALRGLMKLAPETAFRVNAAGGADPVSVSELKPGDLLRVRPGDRVPADGVIRTGSGALDESLLTGESLPVEREPGDRVAAGTILTAGHFDFAADRVGNETALARIVALVAEARRYRAPAQQLADRIAAWFVPAVIGVAAAAWMVWTFGLGRPEQGLEALLAVLLVACPCALGLATPMSLVVGIGAGARAGVLVRNAGALEKLARAQVVMLDKTGTLTRGRPEIRAAEPAEGVTESELLRLAAAVERFSRHPLARAVTRRAERAGIVPPEAADFTEFPGGGVSGTVEGETVTVGSPAWLARRSLVCGEPETAADDASVIAVMRGRRVAGFLLAADELRPDAAAAVAELRASGLTPVLLTGDREAAARNAAAQLGIADVRSGMLPQEKYQAVKESRARSAVTVMVGDGVNDAAALAAADVGVAMGGGTDVAAENAGIVLPGGDVAALLRARRLGRAVTRNIRENLFFAFFYNLLMIPLAAGVFYSLLGWMFHPVLGSLAMSLSSVSVIANALRLRRVKL